MDKLEQEQEQDPESEGFRLSQQLLISAVICMLAISSYFPLMLGVELYDETPEVPYSGASEAQFSVITNAVFVACVVMMLKEALLDSSTLYIPIKIAFPRFIMILGVLIVSLLPNALEFESGMDTLGLVVCTLFAKANIIVGGLMLRLLRDASLDAEAHSVSVPSCRRGLYLYIAAVPIFALQFQINLWGAFVATDRTYAVVEIFVNALSVCIGLYFVFRAWELAFILNHDGVSGHHYYEAMCHVVVALFLFGTWCVVLITPANSWKEHTSHELAAYSFLDLIVICIFFSTSGFIARRKFVSVKSQLATKKYFVRYISHEMRTPLNTVYMGIQLLTTEMSKLYHADRNDKDSDKDPIGVCLRGDSSDGDGDGSTAPFMSAKKLACAESEAAALNSRKRVRENCEGILDDINESLRISLDVLNDLLFVDKIMEGNDILDVRDVNAKDLFQTSIQNFEVQALYSNIDLSMDLRALHSVTVAADQFKIAQVVRNILSNALKFTPNGGCVHVKASFVPDPPFAVKPRRMWGVLRQGSFSSVLPTTLPKEKGTVRVEILDTGPGMSAENKAKLFKKVIQFHHNELQSGGGSGLGMFISHAIVRRHPRGALGVLPGGVVAVHTSGRRRGEVKLTSSKSATTGCAFFIELSGLQHGEADILPFEPGSTDRFGCATIRSSTSFKFPDGGTTAEAGAGETMKDRSIRQERSLRAREREGRDSVREGSIRCIGSLRETSDSVNSSKASMNTTTVGVGQGSFSSRLSGVVPSEEKEKSKDVEDDGGMGTMMFEKVLLVEDSKFNRKMMKLVLASYSKEVVMAEDGVQGVAAVRDCMARHAPPFDVIFMDSLMPNMNGIDATKIILRELQFPNPIIAVTGNMLPDDVREFEEAGASIVLGKPLRVEMLDEALNGILLKRKLKKLDRRSSSGNSVVVESLSRES